MRENIGQTLIRDSMVFYTVTRPVSNVEGSNARRWRKAYQLLM